MLMANLCCCDWEREMGRLEPCAVLQGLDDIVVVPREGNHGVDTRLLELSSHSRYLEWDHMLRKASKKRKDGTDDDECG